MFHVKHMTFVNMLLDIAKSCGIAILNYEHNINN